MCWYKYTNYGRQAILSHSLRLPDVLELRSILGITALALRAGDNSFGKLKNPARKEGFWFL
jgi:hypothetical protein